MAERDRKLILWDYLGTLVSPVSIEPKAKPGIASSLDRLSAIGFSHYIVSSGETEEIEEALKKLHLEGHFQNVFGREIAVNDRGAKSYIPVLEILDLPFEEAAKRMLVIGDSTDDRPPYSTLFVLHEYGYKRSADPEEAIINKMLELNNADLSAAFNSLYESTEEGIGERRLFLNGSSYKIRQRSYTVNSPQITILG